jgi:eukaryotic-like serine/threonine-protein kinase
VLLAGVLPFESETLREGGLEHLRRLVREQDPKTPSSRLASLGEKATEAAANRRTDVRTLARELHRELEWIPIRAMRKEREQRYQSAAELAQDVRNYLDGVPLIAGPPSRFYRIKKFVRRNRSLVTAALAVGLAIVIGTVVSLTMYVKAQVQAQRSEVVSSFLSDTVLSALGPWRQQGGEITALSVLDAVGNALEGKFLDAPLTEAAVRYKLGALYVNAKNEAAIRHLRRALELYRRELGEHDPSTIETMRRLGWALLDEGRVREAKTLLLQAVAESTRQFGDEDGRTVTKKAHLAWSYLALSECGEAMRLFEEVVSTGRRVFGHDHPVPGMGMLGMGQVCIRRGDYDEAERWLSQAVQSSMRARGPDDAYTADFASWLGYVYMLQGRYAEAEQTLVEAVARKVRIFGERNSLTTGSLQALIQLYVLMDRPEDAKKWRARLGSATSADAGRLAGSLQYDETTGTYTIRGFGMDMWDILDEFHFAHKTLQGDGSITA